MVPGPKVAPFPSLMWGVVLTARVAFFPLLFVCFYKRRSDKVGTARQQTRNQLILCPVLECLSNVCKRRNTITHLQCAPC
jgi:hypothetical protein